MTTSFGVMPKSSGPLWRKLAAMQPARTPAPPARPAPPVRIDRALVATIQRILDGGAESPAAMTGSRLAAGDDAWPPAFAGVTGGGVSARAAVGIGARILAEVAAAHGLTPPQLRARRRAKGLVAARHEFFHRMATESDWSFPRIGGWLGGFDHTTAMHGARRHAMRLGLAPYKRGATSGEGA